MERTVVDVAREVEGVIGEDDDFQLGPGVGGVLETFFEVLTKLFCASRFS